MHACHLIFILFFLLHAGPPRCRGAVSAPSATASPLFFNLPLEIVIIILNNTDGNRAACPHSTCGSPVLQHPAREMGQDRGRSPSQERHPHPRLRPTRVTAVQGLAAGIGTWARRGHLPARPPSLPRIPARGCSRRYLQPPASKTDRLSRGV